MSEKNSYYKNEERPTFESLPLRPGDPPFSAWGLYGIDDELGTLNLLTPECILTARSEIITGVTVNLKYAILFPTLKED